MGPWGDGDTYVDDARLKPTCEEPEGMDQLVCDPQELV